MNRIKFRPVSRRERGRMALWLLAVCEDGAIRGNVAHSGVWAQVMDRLIAHGLVAVVERHRYEWLDGLRTTEAGARVDDLIAEAVWAWDYNNGQVHGLAYNLALSDDADQRRAELASRLEHEQHKDAAW